MAYQPRERTYYPLVYALSSEIEGKRFLKLALNENIKRNKALIEKITEIETKHNLLLNQPNN